MVILLDPFLLLSENCPSLGAEGVLGCWEAGNHASEMEGAGKTKQPLGGKLPICSSLHRSTETRGHTVRDSSQRTGARRKRPEGRAQGPMGRSRSREDRVDIEVSEDRVCSSLVTYTDVYQSLSKPAMAEATRSAETTT